MQLDSTALATIGIFLAAQTGALIFFAGVVAAALKSYDHRLNIIEAECRERLKTACNFSATREARYEQI
jgi:hypothetical protein